MSKDKELITGVIRTETKPIVFSAQKDDFCFTFMSDSAYSFPGKNKPISIETKDGFIFGNTHNNHDIAIYYGGKTFEVLGASTLRTSAYIKAKGNLYESNIATFEAISFSGGTINNIFHIDSMNIEHSGNETTIKYKNDEVAYSFNTDECNIDVSINSIVNEKWGLTGKSINNNTAVLTLKFDKEQPLKSLFHHYNKVKDIVSFFTFRYNVGFDEVSLLKTDSESGYLTSVATAYIYEDKEKTKKDCIHNICFEDLGDSLPELLKLFYNQKNKEKSLTLGFYPVSDRDITEMSDVKIRETCSALECELGFISDINVSENKILKELIDSTRACIKEFRKQHPGLSNDTYNTVFSSIGNCAVPLAEKLCALYHKYEEEMSILNLTDMSISNEDIREFVRYRNDITHGKHRTIDTRIATTAYFLGGLVYCCILERVGISREKIKELCMYKILR